METTRKRILVIDDESPMRQLYEEILVRRYIPTICSSGEEALQRFRPGLFDLVLTDRDLGNGKMDGVGLLAALRKSGYRGPAIMVSGHPKPPQEFDGRYLQKPCNISDLYQTIDDLLQR